MSINLLQRRMAIMKPQESGYKGLIRGYLTDNVNTVTEDETSPFYILPLLTFKSTLVGYSGCTGAGNDIGRAYIGKNDTGATTASTRTAFNGTKTISHSFSGYDLLRCRVSYANIDDVYIKVESTGEYLWKGKNVK